MNFNQEKDKRFMPQTHHSQTLKPITKEKVLKVYTRTKVRLVAHFLSETLEVKGNYSDREWERESELEFSASRTILEERLKEILQAKGNHTGQWLESVGRHKECWKIWENAKNTV